LETIESVDAWDSSPDLNRNFYEGRRTAIFTADELTAINNGTYDASDFQGSYTERRIQNNGMIGIRSTNEIHAGLMFLELTTIFVLS